MDSLFGKQTLLAGRLWRDQLAVGIHVGLCPTVARVLECPHLLHYKLEGVQNAGRRRSRLHQAELDGSCGSPLYEFWWGIEKPQPTWDGTGQGDGCGWDFKEQGICQDAQGQRDGKHGGIGMSVENYYRFNVFFWCAPGPHHMQWDFGGRYFFLSAASV